VAANHQKQKKAAWQYNKETGDWDLFLDEMGKGGDWWS